MLTIFDNFDHFNNLDNFWQFWQFSTILTIFWQFFTNFDNFYFFYKFDFFLQFLTIDDNFHNSDNCFCHFDNWKDNPGDLWHLRHWLQFWQLRTRIHDNLCYPTINCGTGQHSQFLRWFCQNWRFQMSGIYTFWWSTGCIEAGLWSLCTCQPPSTQRSSSRPKGMMLRWSKLSHISRWPKCLSWYW